MTTLVLALLLTSPASAKNKVRHTVVEAPAWSVPTVSPDIGAITSMQAGDGALVLGGQKGVAAVAPDGTVKWTVALPETMVRNLAVTADGVAFTAWTLADVEDKGKALNAWASGKLLDKFKIADASVGFVGLDGTLKWQVPATDAHTLAPPAAANGLVAVNTGEHFTVYNAADGAKIGETQLPMAGSHDGMLGGVMDHATRGEIVPIGDALFTSFFSYFFKFDQKGALVDKEFKAGLTPYVDITCGPVLNGDLVVFGTTGDSQVPSWFFAMKEDMKNKWKTPSPDQQSGCGDMVLDGDMVYASSNFWVMAIDAKGKIAWESVNKKGGLYPSANRGIRYVGNFGTRKSYGDLMAVGGGKVYIGTDNGHDVLTVLNADDGKYVRTIDVNQTLVSLAVIDGKLAVATEGGVQLMDL